ncbi:MAG: aspartyl/glutamyl-tRNA(Asn/Gln) amidotransferase C subunit [Candidatus Deianiraeaceae bacterium]|jgi:aspartyl/glutamyl-tRNA(Asn/Gln) amidotransferase C subunit
MEIRKIAKIANIYLKDEDLPSIEKKLDETYQWLDEIKNIDVSKYEPLYNVHAHESSAIRTVENPEFYSPDLTLDNAPKKQDNFILTPKVIER